MKNKVNSIATLIFIIGLFFSEVSFGANAKFSKGQAIIENRLSDGTVIKVVVHTVKYPSNFPYKGIRRWWGADSGKPQFLIEKFEVKINEENIFIPLSVYMDLANPNEMFLDVKNQEAQLVIIGGDAGGSYRTTIIFEKGDVKKRKVSHGEFPEVGEETVYTFNTSTEN